MGHSQKSIDPDVTPQNMASHLWGGGGGGGGEGEEGGLICLLRKISYTNQKSKITS